MYHSVHPYSLLLSPFPFLTFFCSPLYYFPSPLFPFLSASVLPLTTVPPFTTILPPNTSSPFPFSPLFPFRHPAYHPCRHLPVLATNYKNVQILYFLLIRVLVKQNFYFIILLSRLYGMSILGQITK